jgi:hypothetical protein
MLTLKERKRRIEILKKHDYDVNDAATELGMRRDALKGWCKYMKIKPKTFEHKYYPPKEPLTFEQRNNLGKFIVSLRRAYKNGVDVGAFMEDWRRIM